ncbi:DUF3034 family protein [Bermanella marisrubri]|nr:DUF3034 family protein [Bermanella marisrubri]QIZ85193.1 DUF3034 family protein [Bermanella marisrubri]
MKLILSLLLLVISSASAAGGKILATPGVSMVEGSAGGGLVPWSQLAGYATEDEVLASGFCSRASVDDFDLNVCGVQVNIKDRIELSYAEQTFDVNPLSLQLEQSITGAKFRLYGDLVYSHFPQISAGVQYKKLDTPSVPFSLGAESDNGTDVYFTASKLHLGVVVGYNLLWNVSARHTEANQMGLLGFGARGKGASLQLEASAAVLFHKSLAIGVEYRQKPDNLGLGENDWSDVFIAWFPNKHLSITAAYLDLGSIAGIANQKGWYSSITGYF